MVTRLLSCFFALLIAATDALAQCPVQDLVDHDNGNNKYSRLTTAPKAAIAALMSYNAYDRGYRFALPPGWSTVPIESDGKWGLEFEVYKKTTTRKVEKVIIAFRGTEFSSYQDWLWGNFSNRQYKHARSYVQQVITQFPEAKIYTTGHSLGGGLAMRASFDFVGVEAITFSTSPMYRPNSKIKNPKAVVFERGDPIRNFSNLFLPHRWKWLRDPNNEKGRYWGDKDDPFFQKYNFLGWSIIADHSMFKLAEGLLAVAAETNPTHKQLLKVHCRTYYASE